jgi:AcrR family transcriptional regulator
VTARLSAATVVGRVDDEMTKQNLADHRRQEIVRAASRVFAERGYHNAGIADIARELGMGHGTFYRYFANKRDILLHVIDDAMARIAVVVADETAHAADTLAEARAQAERIGSALFDVFVAEPQFGRLFFIESMSVDDDLTGRMLQVNDALSELTARILRNGVGKGFLRPDVDVVVAARAVNGMIFAGALALLRAPNPEAEREPWVRTVTSLMFDGLAGARPA